MPVLSSAWGSILMLSLCELLMSDESAPELGGYRLSRQQIVEELLWFMAQHGCCGDPDVYATLLAEAREQGWELPDGL